MYVNRVLGTDLRCSYKLGIAHVKGPQENLKNTGFNFDY